MNMETISIVFCILVIIGLGIIIYKKMDTFENLSSDQNSIEKETTNNLEQFGSPSPLCNTLLLSEFFSDTVLNPGAFKRTIDGWTITGTGGIQRLTTISCRNLEAQGGNGQTGFLTSPSSMVKSNAGIIYSGVYQVSGKVIYRTDTNCNLTYKVSFMSGSVTLGSVQHNLTYNFNTKIVTSSNNGLLDLSVIINNNSTYLNKNFGIKIEILPGSVGQANFNNIIVTGPGLCPIRPTTTPKPTPQAPTTTMPPTTQIPTMPPFTTTTTMPTTGGGGSGGTPIEGSVCGQNKTIIDGECCYKGACMDGNYNLGTLRCDGTCDSITSTTTQRPTIIPPTTTTTVP